jgi:hypothetical protein
MKQINEIKRMQQLAGIITESKLNEDMALSNQKLNDKSEITGKSIMDIYNMMSEIDDMDSIQEIGFIISNKDWSNRNEFSTKQKIYKEIQKHIDDKVMVDDLNKISKDLLSLIQSYVSYDYTADQGYGTEIDNAEKQMEKIKSEIIAQKGEQYFELVKEFANLSTYDTEYAGPEDSDKIQPKLEELSGKLGFTMDQLRNI